MRRNTKVQMAIEDASDWDDGTLEDYIVNLEQERDELKRRVEELEDQLSRALAHGDCWYGAYYDDQKETE